MNDLTYRILSLAHKHKRSHIGSCLTAAPILDEIYRMRGPNDPVILSAGHAFLALACVLEKHCGKDAGDLIQRHGVHPTKNEADGIYASTGSLGQGLSLAVGRALADRNRSVWVYISDGEGSEGVVYESLGFAGRAKLTNLRVYCGWNGYGAYRESDFQTQYALNELFPVSWRHDFPGDIPFLRGQDAHYHQMTEEDWKWVEENRRPAAQTCPDCGGRGEHYMALHSPPILIGCSRCGGSGRIQP